MSVRDFVESTRVSVSYQSPSGHAHKVYLSTPVRVETQVLDEGIRSGIETQVAKRRSGYTATAVYFCPLTPARAVNALVEALAAEFDHVAVSIDGALGSNDGTQMVEIRRSTNTNLLGKAMSNAEFVRMTA